MAADPVPRFRATSSNPASAPTTRLDSIDEATPSPRSKPPEDGDGRADTPSIDELDQDVYADPDLVTRSRKRTWTRRK